MQRYEKPRLTPAGTFRKATGLLSRHGNDRLILSKN
ncbi:MULTISPECIES: keywimysin-related RiPP [Nonomuraea]|uniref:Lasso RiPP family leader peptide-containing protein n=1 Tax=Nonomuraea composti TaxID=2720023 RepID=A0ABX1BBZ9_9ACTN|nr:MULTISPECIES: keywimysin-related RiPP [unclassified Nonomuraea]NJP92841.1 lasso RiPP family leader peptide-containing protein [Nonomuraea sp. FMUSA5-5]